MTTPWHRCALAAGLLACSLVAQAAEYVVLIQDQPAGHLRVQTLEGGRVETDFSYRDNGRGPDQRESFTLDDRGVPLAYEVTGRSTFGAEMRETFRREAGRAVWKSQADEGDIAVSDNFVFIPLDGSSGYFDAVNRLLLAGGSAPTIGGLKLQAEKIAALALDGPAGPVKLALVAVTGAEAQPWYSWVRDDGTNAFFASTWPGWALVEKGFEALVPPLLARQQQAVDERDAMLRKRLAQPLDGLTLIRAVRWFDAPAARMRGPSDVWLFDGRIGAVTAPGALAAKPDRVVDGQGRTLLPGLWDMHAHMWSGAGLAHLAAGVTSVRDMGNQNADLQRLRGRTAAGGVAGPAIHPAGFIEGKSAFSSRNGFVVETLQAGLDAVDWYAARGYRSIKLYNSIKPEWVKPLAARAKAQGLRVSGHVPAFMRAEEAVRAGYDELTHINQVMLNFVVRPGDDARTLVRFERVGADGHKLDLQSPKAKAFLRLLRERGTAVDPTLGAFEAMFTQSQGQPNPSIVAVADHLPVLWQRGLRAAEMDLAGAKLKTFRSSFARLQELTVAMHRAGVPLVAGTDGWDGIGLHRELELYVQGGIPALQALRIGTWNGAFVAGEGGRGGRIERGYAADLVLIDGDPSVDITHLRRASLVLQGRVAYAPDQLYEAMGFKPFVAGARVEVPAP
jgi:Amidohydrolase family